MHPPRFPFPHDPRRRAEKTFFEACARQLDDSWRVLYSVDWHGPMEGKNDDSDADFLFLHSQKGIFTVEVKGGQEIFVERGKWWSVPHGHARGDLPTDTRRIEIKDPFKQASLSKRALFDYIRTNLPTLRLKGSFGHFVAFPGHRQDGDMAPHAKRSLICDKEDMQRLTETLERLSNLSNQHHQFAESDIDAIAEKLVPTFRLFGARNSELTETLDELDRLTEVQLKVFAMLNVMDGYCVTGGPGTGKTILAFHRAKELANRGFKVLLLICSSELNDRLNGELSRLSPEIARNIFVRTSRQLFWEFVHSTSELARNGRLDSAQFLQDDAMVLRELMYVEFRSELLSEVALEWSNSDSRTYDAVIIDEMQLLSVEWYEVIRTLIRPNGKHYVFGDPNQRVDPGFYEEAQYGLFATNERKDSALGLWKGPFDTIYGGRWNVDMDRIPGRQFFDAKIPHSMLNLNCRSTKEIATYCRNVIGATDVADEAIAYSGGAATYIRATPQETLLEVPKIIESWLSEYGLDPNEIAVLTLNPLFLEEEQPVVIDNLVTDHGSFRIDWTVAEAIDGRHGGDTTRTSSRQELTESSTAIQGRSENNGTDQRQTPTIKVRYYADLLGVEATGVVVIALNRQGFGRASNGKWERSTLEDEPTPWQNMVYTASSRARFLLAVVGDAESA